MAELALPLDFVEVMLDASQLGAFEPCPRKWYYAYVKNWESRLYSRALNVGSYYHEVLAFHYSNPSNIKEYPARTNETLLFARREDLFKQFGIMLKEDRIFHLKRIQAYLFFWELEDQRATVVAVEKGFSRLLYESKDRRYILEGKIDLVVRRPNLGLCVEDHKTQSSRKDIWPVNNQVMNYFTYVKPDYFIYDYIGLADKINDKTFERKVFRPSLDQISQWEEDVIRAFDDMYSYVKAGGKECCFPRRRSACSATYGVCQFHKLCNVRDDSKFRPAMESAYKERDEKWRAWT